MVLIPDHTHTAVSCRNSPHNIIQTIITENNNDDPLSYSIDHYNSQVINSLKLCRIGKTMYYITVIIHVIINVFTIITYLTFYKT